MKVLVLFLVSFLLSFTAFAQNDSLNTAKVVNSVIEESNQFSVLVYLYRVTNSKSPKDSIEFFNYLSSNNYPMDFKFIRNINFYDTNKVSYDFSLSGEGVIKLDDSTELSLVKAKVILDYFTDFESTIHTIDIKIDSAVINRKSYISVISNKHESGIYIRLEKEDLLNLKTIVTNDYETNTPEYLIMESVRCIQNQDWKSYADILYPDDLDTMKSAFDYVMNSGKGRELLPYFDNVSTKEEFLKLSPKEFFPEFMKFVLTVNPQYAFASKNLSLEIIGKVKENDMVHVVVRGKMNYMNKSFQQLSVNTAIKVGDKYYLKMNDDLKQVSEQIKAMAGQ